MKNKIVDVRELTKKYNKSGTLALDNIDLSIEKGSIFGLLVQMVQEKVHL